MIEFSYQTDFELTSEKDHSKWLVDIADGHDSVIESVGYVFCDDEFVHSINLKHLNHDTYTDIITFDYGTDDVLDGEIYISVDRVRENAVELNQLFEVELRRVMAHGLLHMMGFGDHDENEKIKMREMEDNALSMFHVKQ